MFKLNGFLVVDKPAGMTSAAVVAKVKQLLPAKTKIGHTGTLDPNVTGVLVLALGRATKAITFLDDEIKVYRASLKFGIKTDSADIWGDVIAEANSPIFSKEQIEASLNTFIGITKQIPPMYSALKKDGQRLYQLARKGELVERSAREITISQIGLIDYHFPELTFEVTCSRGTYVRTLCEDIAEKLGTIATMTSLVRLQTSIFTLEDSFQLKQLSSDNIAQNLVAIEKLFYNLPKIEVDKKHAIYLYNGVKVDLSRFYDDAKSARFTIYYQEHFIGIAQRKDNAIYCQKLLGNQDEII